MTVDGPIFFHARGASLIPCSPSCYSCLSASASSSRAQATISDFPNAYAAHTSGHHTGAEKGVRDLEWARIDSDSDAGCLILTDFSRGHAAMNDVCSLSPPDSRSFRPARACSKHPEMTLAFDDYQSLPPKSSPLQNPRSSVVRHPGRIRAESSISQAPPTNTDHSSQAISGPSFHLAPCRQPEDHAYGSQCSIWDWIAAVESRRQPLLNSPPPLSESLQVPCDVYSESVASSSITSSSAQQSTMPAYSSSSFSPLSNISPLASPSSTSDLVQDDWRHPMDKRSNLQAFQTSPASSSAQSSMGPALLMESTLLDESLCRSLLGQWHDAEKWRRADDFDGGGSASGSSRGRIMEDAYPRSATSSSRRSDAGFQPVELPTIPDHQDFSTLVLQSFTLALADASLDEDGGKFNHGSEADNASVLSCPTHLHDFDFMDQWSPPALRSSSSASSSDPFHLELFSPASEHADAASVWDESHRSPEDSSTSGGYYSSSPFVGWSSASDTDAKPVLLSMGRTAFAAIPLHQPQPIRPIPPIPIHLLDDVAH